MKWSHSCKCIFSPSSKRSEFLTVTFTSIQCDRVYEEQPTVSDVEEGAGSEVDNTNSAHVEAEEIDDKEDLEVIEEEPEYDNTSTNKNYKPETDTDTGEETDEDDNIVKGPR